jgi:hypothetical protein
MGKLADLILAVVPPPAAVGQIVTEEVLEVSPQVAVVVEPAVALQRAVVVEPLEESQPVVAQVQPPVALRPAPVKPAVTEQVLEESRQVAVLVQPAVELQRAVVVEPLEESQPVKVVVQEAVTEQILEQAQPVVARAEPAVDLMALQRPGGPPAATPQEAAQLGVVTGALAGDAHGYPAQKVKEHSVKSLADNLAGQEKQYPVPPDPAKTGLSKRELRPEYQGEDREMGWFALSGLGVLPGESEDEAIQHMKVPLKQGETEEDLVRFHQLGSVEELRRALYRMQKAKEATDESVRVNFTQQDQVATSVRTDVNDPNGKDRFEDGTVRAQGGQPLNGQAAYVVDPETGKMHAFKTGNKKVARVDERGQTITDEAGYAVMQELRTHHSSALAGEAVAGAGQVTVKDGKVVAIDNLSGHYKPGSTEMLQTVEHLARQGALLDKTYTDANGQPLTGEALRVYTTAMKVQQMLEQKLAQGQRVEGELKVLAKAKGMLAKLGAAPANRMGDAKVAFLDIPDHKKATMTGAQIRDAAKEAERGAISAEEFLASGGGNPEQLVKKDAMQVELRRKMAGHAEELDAGAEKVRARVEQFIQQLPAELQALKAQLAQGGQDEAVTKRLQERIAGMEALLHAGPPVTDDDLRAVHQQMLDVEARLAPRPPAPAAAEDLPPPEEEVIEDDPAPAAAANPAPAASRADDDLPLPEPEEIVVEDDPPAAAAANSAAAAPPPSREDEDLPLPEPEEIVVEDDPPAAH